MRRGRGAGGGPTGATRGGREGLSGGGHCSRGCAWVTSGPGGARSLETPLAAALARSFREPKPNVTLL